MSPSLRELLNAFDAELPLDRARTIPSAWYFDPELYALECRNVFGTVWTAVGRADQVAAPGAFLTLEVAGEPIVVVRGSDGVLRAFSNVCRHRAAQVINEPQGVATKLRCRYHGWTYDLCGQLRGTPEFEGVMDFCREDFGLPELGVAEWGPLVFVTCARPRNDRRWRRSWRRCRSEPRRWGWTGCTSRSGASTCWSVTGRCSWTTTRTVVIM